jgi:bifunctional DNA-binding transcriptional regulator/antitoxin component of YhaV-PrlF toxin-antitoxin module
LHYDGWITLPAEARQHLDVTTGDRLDIEFTETGLLLRSAKQTAIAALEPEAAVTPPAAEPIKASEPVEAGTMVAKRGPGRPRKAVTPDLTPSVKVGGRRKSLPAGTA